MADSRIIHKKASGGERVCSLDHLEHRVWVQYVLSADDYGVMRCSVSGIRHDNPRLESEPLELIEAALRRVLGVGLVQSFTHQGKAFLWQIDWQDFQQVRYPRQTVNPAPAAEELKAATVATRKLFRDNHPQYSRKPLNEKAETFHGLPYAGAARNTNTNTDTNTRDLNNSEESARETTAIGPNRRRNGVGLVGDHLRCPPGMWAACARGICVPVFLANQWRAQVGDTAAEDFVERVIEAMPEGAVGDDPLKFWRAAWTSEHGTVAPKAGPESPTAQAIRAGREYLGER